MAEGEADKVSRGRSSTYYRRLREAEREWIDGRWVHPNPGKSGHGSLGGYTGYGCRCQACLDAMRAYQNRWREALGTGEWQRAERRRRHNRRERARAQSSADREQIDLSSVFTWDPS